MGIGTTVRHRLGRFEEPAAEAYRSAFINLDDMRMNVQAAWEAHRPGSAPARILEIGCGEGAAAQRLTQAWPEATYLGIDPSPDAGRMYAGPTERVEFRVMTSSKLVAEQPGTFDLVVIIDVLHHIPASVRPTVLSDAAALLAPDGLLLVKEWEQGRLLFGKLAYLADRYVTGDKDVDFMNRAQLEGLLAETLPELSIVGRGHVRPWKENVLLGLSR